PIELSADQPTKVACDSGDCFFVNTVSWRNETTPNPTELHPRVVFERLFGDGGTAAERLAHIRKTGSILDSVSVEVSRLSASLGGGDRSKLSEYLESVRDIEQRIQNAEQQGTHTFERPDRPADLPPSRVSDQHADDKPAADAPGVRRHPAGHSRRQHGQARTGLPFARLKPNRYKEIPRQSWHPSCSAKCALSQANATAHPFGIAM